MKFWKSIIFLCLLLTTGNAFAAAETTPNLGLVVIPFVPGTWGEDVKENFDKIDTAVGAGLGVAPLTSEQLRTSLTDETGTGVAVFGTSPTFSTQITTPKIVLGSCQQLSGAGTPEGNVTAPVCSTYVRTNGGSETTFYVKESGSGNTGWIGYGNPSGTGAPTGATYITQTCDGGLSAEQCMSALGTGLVKNTTATGVQSIAVLHTDYLSPASPITNGQLPSPISSKTFDNTNVFNVLSTLFTFQDNTDPTKQARFNFAGNPTATTAIYAWPVGSTTILGDSDFPGSTTGAMERTGASSYKVVKNASAAISPTANDDSSAGYSVGSMWLNTATPTWFRALTVGVGTATWQNLGATVESDGLSTIMGRDNSAVAESYANGLKICNAGDTVCVSRFIDAAFGPRDQCSPECDARTFIPTNKNYVIYDEEGAATVLTIDPDAASKNAMYQFGANYKPVISLAAPLTERGAVTIALAEVVSGASKDYYATITDADTDALDFSFPVTTRMVGMTTATVRLEAISRNAAPAGNMVLACALNAYRPGTDTRVAHSATGAQSVTLTPAVQNRDVAATSAAITINGTVADGGRIRGSCVVSAAGTTSAQLSDFFLLAQATIKLSVNSISD